MEAEEILRTVIRNRDVKFLCRYYFNEKITPLQEVLIRKVTFQSYKRFIVCAMTRWGKTWCVSRGVALFLLMNRNRKIIFVAPQREQASILRDYMAELIYKCPVLTEITDLDISGLEKIKKQASRSRQTFSNDCEYRVFTAHGGGSGLMGFGLGSDGGIVVVDEGALVDDDAWAKITRMLGDNPDKSTIIELLNPWDRATRVFDHWNADDYEKFHVGWEDAIKDGRTTKEFVEQQRKELTKLEFQVLYESMFPDEGEDSVFNLLKIKEAEKKKHNTGSQFIISCDVADKGLDKTVIIVGCKHKYGYSITDIYSEDKSENTDVAGRILDRIKQNLSNKIKVFIDVIGVGAGVHSMVKTECEIINQGRAKNKIKVVGCHFGENPVLEIDRFANKKSENYFRLRELFIEGMISIPHHKILFNELLAIKWKFSGKHKIIIIDPEQKSPDFADALVYFCWYDDEIEWSPALA